jgi:antitoxin (DNA-binding transcriptional repressor) of toxin-antitoxin stability system
MRAIWAVEGVEERAAWGSTAPRSITQQDLAVLVKRALAGEEIVIETDDRQVRLSPVPAPPAFDAETARRRGYAVLTGKLVVGPEFFEPLSPEEYGLGGDEKADP